MDNISGFKSSRQKQMGWLCWLGLLPGLLLAADDIPFFRILEARSTLVEQVYSLYADIELVLPKPLQSALQQGLPLYFTTLIKIERKGRWWGYNTVATLQQQYRLEYHELSGHFLVVNRNTGLRHRFGYLVDALHFIGRLRRFPLLDRKQVNTGVRHKATITISLDRGSLPSPLYFHSYISGEWGLTSPPFEWILH